MMSFSRISRWMTSSLVLLCLVVVAPCFIETNNHQVNGFGYVPSLLGGAVVRHSPTRFSESPREQNQQQQHVSFFNEQRTKVTTTRLRMGFLDDIGAMFKRFNTSANASHILIKGGSEAANKLEDLKIEIGDSPVKFAEIASRYSQCPSSRSGGNLGDFGPGQMVKEFDQVVFNDEVGKVHGPIQTQFGYHLILINERTD